MKTNSKGNRRGLHKAGPGDKRKIPCVRRKGVRLSEQPHLVLTLQKFRAIAALTEKKPEQVAIEQGIGVRTLYDWRREFENFILWDPECRNALATLYFKAIKVIDKYLSGRGRKVGGDLQAAFRLLESINVVSPRNKFVIDQKFDQRGASFTAGGPSGNKPEIPMDPPAESTRWAGGIGKHGKRLIHEAEAVVVSGDGPSGPPDSQSSGS